MTHIQVLRRLQIPAVPHGFRSSFRDWVIEQTDTPWVIGEAALAHNLEIPPRWPMPGPTCLISDGI